MGEILELEREKRRALFFFAARYLAGQPGALGRSIQAVRLAGPLVVSSMAAYTASARIFLFEP